MIVDEISVNDRKPKLINARRENAVLIPLVFYENKWQVLFEIRSAKIASQPGDICFPGGGREGNESFEETAIRETVEEIGAPLDKIEVICESDYYARVTFEIKVFIAKLHINSLDELNLQTDEVDNVFLVPLEFFKLTKADKYILISEYNYPDNFPFDLIANGREYKWYTEDREVLFYQYKDKVIWGLTAKIINNAVDRIRVVK